MNRIIFKKTDGTVGVMIPTEEALSFATLEEIAIKDVPKDAPFKLIDMVDLPDRGSREYWLWNNDITPDGVGGASNEF